jgi:flavodoxin
MFWLKSLEWQKEADMKKACFTLPVIATFLAVTLQISFATEGKMTNTNGNNANPASGKKILVAYFSHSGNTRVIANDIHNIVGGDIFEIKSAQTYPEDYNAVVKKAKQELNSGYKPALKTKVENIGQYDVVFIGYPNWWGTFPAPVKTFLSEYDLSGKTIAPFCTNEGSGLGRSVTDISKLCPKSVLLEGLAIRGSTVKTAQTKVSEWLRKIKIIK